MLIKLTNNKKKYKRNINNRYKDIIEYPQQENITIKLTDENNNINDEDITDHPRQQTFG